MARSTPLHTEIDRDLEIGLRTADLTDLVDRLILSDQLEAVGREREALYLRSPNPCQLVEGRIEASIVRVVERMAARGETVRGRGLARAYLVVCRTDQRGRRAESHVEVLERSAHYVAHSPRPLPHRASILDTYSVRAAAERTDRCWEHFDE